MEILFTNVEEALDRYTRMALQDKTEEEKLKAQDNFLSGVTAAVYLIALGEGGRTPNMTKVMSDTQSLAKIIQVKRMSLALKDRN